MSIKLKTIYLLLGVCACASDPGLAFRSDSPANAESKPALRPSVAAVLADKDPLAATVCAKDAPCVLPTSAPATPPADPHAGHHHHHNH